MKIPILAAIAALALCGPAMAGPLSDGATSVLIARNYCVPALDIDDERMGAMLYAAAGELGVSIDEATITIATTGAMQGDRLVQDGKIVAFCAAIAELLE